MGKEIELKYVFQNSRDAALVFSDPAVQAAIVDQIKTINMISEYYDTEDQALSQSKAALRRRSENESTVFTLKTAGTEDGALSTRGEWQITCATLREALDKFSQIKAISPLLNGISPQNLIKIAAINFTRTCADVALPGGGLAELCVDIGRFFHGQRSAPFCELELELKQGDPDALRAFGSQLQQRFDLKPEPRSKLVRAQLV